MPKRPSLLNVRQQLEYAQLIMEGLEKYGMCPALKDEIRKFILLNKAIIRKHDTLRAKGNRHDLYVTREPQL